MIRKLYKESPVEFTLYAGLVAFALVLLIIKVLAETGVI